MQTQDYFSGLAAVYDANRPSYPSEAIDFVLDGLPNGAIICDVGCGTGISARLLKKRGGANVRIVGVDPNSDMLEQARRASAESNLDIDYRVGTGERTCLDEASVDCVVIAQAFHWLKADQALREFHRVLRVGGRLALIWNVRDDAHDAFTIAYSDIARRSMANARAHGLETHELRSADPTVGGQFDDVVVRVFSNPHRMTWEGLLGRARSASYFPRSGDRLRDVLEKELRGLFDAHARDGVVTLWHRTEVTRAKRRD